MENEGENQDVNNVDTTTTDDSSNVDQTTTTTDDTTADDTNGGEQDGDDTMADGSKRSEKTVPYEVFANTQKEINDLKQQIAEMNNKSAQNKEVDPVLESKKEEAKKALKDILSEMGYVSKEDLQRDKADQALESDLKRLEKQWDGKADPALKFNRKEVIDYALQHGIGNPEMAFKLLKEKELTNFRIREAMKGSTGVKTEGSNSTGSGEVGPSNDDLKTAAIKGDKSAGLAYMKRAIAGTRK